MSARKRQRPWRGADGIGATCADAHQATPAGGEAIGEQPGMEVIPVTMKEVLERSNVVQALRTVRANKGAPGVDGMTVDEMVAFEASEKWVRIRSELMQGRYKPAAVRGVEIPKANGTKRLLGIPTVIDRLIQQAILRTLQPGLDPTFSVSSFGFRPGRNVQQAVQHWLEHVEEGYEWVISIDLAKFFDRVQHDVLMARVARRVRDKAILKAIGNYLRAGMMLGGISSPRIEGTPQGGPLSPLLSNILLDDLDRELEERGHRFVRYADDFIIVVKSQRSAERVYDSVVQFLEQRLKLQVNQEKSKISQYWEIEYLGFKLYRDKTGTPRIGTSQKLQKKIRAKLRATLGTPARGTSFKEVIKQVNQILLGLWAHIKIAYSPFFYSWIDGYVRRRLRWICLRHWKKPRVIQQKLRALGLSQHGARSISVSRKGPWRLSATPELHRALDNTRLAHLGLVSLLNLHERNIDRLHQPRQLSLPFE